MVVELAWTIVPFLIIILMALPATKVLVAQKDTTNADLTVKVTGYQWMWKYEYLGEDVTFTSRLDRKSDEVRQSGSVPTMASDPHYLLDVDNPLVLPVDTKVRIEVRGSGTVFP